MSSNLWSLYKNYRCSEEKVIKDLTITNSLGLSCNTIDDVSGINFCDGTYIGHGASFDITTNEILKINTDSIVVDTNQNVGIGRDPVTGKKLAVLGDTLVTGNINTENININGVEVIDATRNIHTNKIEGLTYPTTNIEILENVIQFDTSYGYLRLDATNGDWLHLLTELHRIYVDQNFVINADLYMYGGSAVKDSVVIDNDRNIFTHSIKFDDTSNNIVLFSGSNSITQNASNAFYVNPIRSEATTTIPNLVYDTSNAEIRYESSSIKYKKNVTDLTEDTSVLTNLQGREYDTIRDNIHSVGYIAEEANEASSNFTWKNPDGTPEGIAWNNILVYAVEEIKKLRNEVDSLKEQVRVLTQ